MPFQLQPILENDIVKLQPIIESDFDKLFSVANDPLIWEQHPNPDRYKLDAFTNYFNGAILSKGAFIIFDKITGVVIGSTRFYDYDETKSEILIGYTFLIRSHWGTTFNHLIKSLMLAHAFKYVEKVIFHIGASNIRSQKAITKLGAQKKPIELEVAYYSEPSKLNFVYEIQKENWLPIK